MAPVVIYLTVVLLIPIIQNILTSFQAVELLSDKAPRFVGLDNYLRLLNDKAFWNAIRVTFIYTFLVVTVVMTTALLVALLMNRRFKGRTLSRGIITIPWAFPEVAAVLLWTWMLSQNFGVLNVFVHAFFPQTNNIPFLTHPGWAMFSLILMTTWKIFPFYTLVLLTALQTVHHDLYEAAKVDGASPIQSFRHVTLPGIASVLGLLILLITIWSFRRFTSIYLLTGGGPGIATETLVVKVYNTAFKFFDLGYGSTLGIAGLLLSVVFALIYFRLHKRFVVEKV